MAQLGSGRSEGRCARGGAIAAALVLLGASACLPTNPGLTTEGSESEGETSDTGGDASGLFSCSSPPCSFVVVSQTLDDRVDVFDAQRGELRGRIDLDLKPDPSGQQITGNLLDEPYGLLAGEDRLRVLVGHYPDTDSGSLLSFPHSMFAALEAGATAPVSDFFADGEFSGGADHLALAREEALFMLEHPSGALLISVFNNSLTSFDWTTPSQLLILDPETGAQGVVDLATLDTPCSGAWSLVALDDAMGQVAMACDGSDSVAVLNIPAELSDPAAAAAAVTGCGYATPVGAPDTWTTRFLAPDGAGGLLLTQSSPVVAPRLMQISGSCDLLGPAGSASSFEELRALRETVLLRAAGEGGPYWLAAGGGGRPGVYVLRTSGVTPELCGELPELPVALTGGVEANEPFALALDSGRAHLAVGAGPTPDNLPETREGRGQVLWVSLNTDGLAGCDVRASEVVELNAGLFAPADPRTWSRAPNTLTVLEVGGSS